MLSFKDMINIIDERISLIDNQTIIGPYRIRIKPFSLRYHAVYKIYKASSDLKCLEIREGIKKIKVIAYKWIGNTEMSHSKLVSFDDTIEVLKDDPVLYDAMHFFYTILKDTIWDDVVDQFSDREND